MKVLLLSPLAGGLGHYTKALARTLEDCGAAVDRIEVPEPIVTGGSRIAWFAAYSRALIMSRSASADLVMATWPAIGYWDYLGLKALGGVRAPLIVMHDPVPLVHARGYGSLARRVAVCRPVNGRAMVHSALAADALAQTPAMPTTILPHPMLPPVKRREQSADLTVRVVGQFKASRDLDALHALRQQGPESWIYEIVGRGWPKLPGWTTQSSFLSEAAFSRALATASVVLIPYRQFFQSGVALRCLEYGVPFVGPKNSTLAELVGEAGWLADGPDDWLAAVRAASDATPEDVLEVARATYRRTMTAWRTWVNERRRPDIET